jgi:murein DD-endopeptidase MepM/ murein hydrolase activator NlpD
MTRHVRSAMLRAALAGAGAVALTGAAIGTGVTEARADQPFGVAADPTHPVATDVTQLSPVYEQTVRRAAVAAQQRAIARAQAAQAAQAAARKAEAKRAAARASRAAARDSRWQAPISGYRISAGFGRGGGQWSSGRHTGQDFSAPTGTPVRAAAAGTVIAAGWDGRYGRRIEIRHGDGTVSSYSHLSSISVEGGRVAAGQRIGSVGTSGNTSGPHLHFEIERGGRLIDPLDFLRDRGVRI